jgi:uncharacterized protein (TIGR00369 family)
MEAVPCVAIDASKQGAALEPEDHYSGSPFLAMLNTTVEEWRDGYARIGLILERKHLNRSGVVHGGVLATLLDHTGGFCGLYCTVPGNRRYGMTLSLTTNYVGQSAGGRLFAIGERVSGGGRIYHSRTEVRTDGDLVVATGSGVYRYRSGSEKPEGVAPRQYGRAPQP